MERSQPPADASSSTDIDGPREPRGTSAERGGPSHPHRLRRVGLVVALVGAALAAPGTVHAAHAESTKQLEHKLNRLNNKIEKQAEQYNGKKIELHQAERAVKVAEKNVRRQRRAIAKARGSVGRIAATSYMTGGMDPTIHMATDANPRRYIDQSTILHHLANQNGNHIDQLSRAERSARHAANAANKRKRHVRKLVSQLGKKKSHIEKLVAKTQSKVFKRVLRGVGSGHKISPSVIPGNTLGDKALRAALGKQGDPYVWGAAGPSSFDCSGLMMWAYKQVGVNIPHYTVAQFHAGRHVSHPQPGDLILFYPPSLHHVGMYIGNGLMLHAPHTGDVVRVAPIGGRPIGGYVRPY